MATSAASSATIVLPEPTSPCSSRFIGCGRLHVVDDLLERRPLPRRQPERQHGAAPHARMRSSTTTRERLAPPRRACAAPAASPTGTGRTPRRSGAAAPACGTRSAGPATSSAGGKVRLDERCPRGRADPAPSRRSRGQRVLARSAGRRVSTSCTRRRCSLGVIAPTRLVDRHDAAGVDRGSASSSSSISSSGLVICRRPRHCVDRRRTGRRAGAAAASFWR